MLVVYTEQLQIPQQELLIEWRLWVNYWPRSWANTQDYNAAIPLDWYLLFRDQLHGLQWMLRWPDHSRVIYTLD